jgi:hypothetical protein
MPVKVRQLACARPAIESLRIPAFAIRERRCDVDLEEFAGVEPAPCCVSLGPERRDQRYQRNQLGVDEQRRNLRHVPHVLYSRFDCKAEIAIDAVAQIIAIEQRGVAAEIAEAPIDQIGDG